MAKKKSAGGFNMSQAIRDILKENSKLSGKEVKDVLSAKHPSAKINDNSFSVAYYNARNKLGISSSRRRRRKSAGAAKGTRPAMRPRVDLSTLQSARKFLAEVGNADAALEAIKQVQALQVK